jgi:acyl-coenzyme A thioesterase PaaI-like protein
MSHAHTVVVSRRWRGYPWWGHGGYVAGLVGAKMHGCVNVRFRQPTPLERTLELRVDERGRSVLRDGDRVLVHAKQSRPLHIEPPDIPSYAEAEAASAEFLVRRPDPVYDGCAVCGQGRRAGDGLRLAVGSIRPGLSAAPWVPPDFVDDGSGCVQPAIVFAVLDCPGAYALWTSHRPAPGETLVTAALQVERRAPVRIGEKYVVAGWTIATAKTLRYCGTALTSQSGEVLAAATATWMVAPKKRLFGRTARP